MLLSDYLKNNSTSELADAVGIAASFLSSIAAGRRPATAKYCHAIEQATGGQVTRKDLRPDDWWLIWPELVERPVQIATPHPHPSPLPQGEGTVLVSEGEGITKEVVHG